MEPNQLTNSVYVVLAEMLFAFLLLWVISRVLSRLNRTIFSLPILKEYAKASEVTGRNLRVAVMICSFLLCLGVAGGNAYLIYHGEDPGRFLIHQMHQVSMETWWSLSQVLLKVCGLFMVTWALLRIATRGLERLNEKAKSSEGVQENSESLSKFFRSARRSVTHIAWLSFLTLSANVLALPVGAQNILGTVLQSYVIIAVGWLLFRGLSTILSTVEFLAKKYADEKGLLRYYDQTKVLMPVLRRVIEASIYLIVATLIAQQIEATKFLSLWGLRLLTIVGYFFVARVLVELTKLMVEEALLSRADLEPEERQRRLTFVPLAQSTVKYSIYFVLGISTLRVLQIDPTPVLAGVGILGLAASFGAQKLVADLVSGFFILFEGHYLVGDIVVLGGHMGEVVAIDLRTTHLRRGNGQYVILRNSSIDEVQSLSRDFTYACLSIPVPYSCDLKFAQKAIEEVGQEMLEEEGQVIGETGILGVSEFRENCMVLSAWCKLGAGVKWGIECQLRQRIYERLLEKGMEIPYPHQVLIRQSARDLKPFEETRFTAGPPPGLLEASGH